MTNATFQVTQEMLETGYGKFISHAINCGIADVLLSQRGKVEFPQIVASKAILTIIRVGSSLGKKIEWVFPTPDAFYFLEGGQVGFYYSNQQKIDMLELYSEVFPYLEEALEKVRSVI